MPSMLIDTDQLMVRTGQRDIPEVADLLETMGLAASLFLEGELLTSFDAATTKDIFYFEGVRTTLPHGTLAVKNGFVDTATVTVSYANTLGALKASPIVLPASEYEMSEDGVCVLYNTPRTPRYLQVEYSYGFTSLGGVYTPLEVPSWLKELATQYVVYRVNSQAPFRKAQKKEAMAGEPVMLKALLAAHVRMYPHANKPIL